MTSPQIRPPTGSRTAQPALTTDGSAGRGASAGSRSAGADAGGSGGTGEPGLPETGLGATGPRADVAVGPDHRPADDLVIAGLVPMSTVDWPDHLTATVFLQGCPWNCFYCHNQDLIPARTPSQVAWEEVRALLRRRRGLLDGVVLTGGEALRQDALADAAREVMDMGFQVGLHTAGPYPRRLRDMIEAGLIDWVGLDIKALPEHYGQVVGRANAATKAWESLEVLIEAADRGGPDFEVRTTVVPGDVTADDAVEAARRVHAAGARVYALQQARAEGTSGEFDVVAPGWDGICERMAERIEALGWDRFTYRPA